MKLTKAQRAKASKQFRRDLIAHLRPFKPQWWLPPEEKREQLRIVRVAIAAVRKDRGGK